MCTSFSISKNGTAFAALNFDWHDNRSGEVIFRRARYGKKAYIMTSKYGRHFPYDGMNDEGLYISQTAVPTVKRAISFKNPYLSSYIVPVILEECATVDDAIAVLTARSVIFGTFLGLVMFHFLIADARGNSAIVEFMNVTRVHVKSRDYQLMTNYYLADPSIRWKNHVEGCGGYDRYDNAESILSGLDNPSFSRCASVCRGSLMNDFFYDGKTLNTLWSGIYDLVNRTMRLYTGKNFSRYVEYDLTGPENLRWKME